MKEPTQTETLFLIMGFASYLVDKLTDRQSSSFSAYFGDGPNCLAWVREAMEEFDEYTARELKEKDEGGWHDDGQDFAIDEYDDDCEEDDEHDDCGESSSRLEPNYHPGCYCSYCKGYRRAITSRVFAIGDLPDNDHSS